MRICICVRVLLSKPGKEKWLMMPESDSSQCLRTVVHIQGFLFNFLQRKRVLVNMKHSLRLFCSSSLRSSHFFLTSMIFGDSWPSALSAGWHHWKLWRAYTQCTDSSPKGSIHRLIDPSDKTPANSGEQQTHSDFVNWPCLQKHKQKLQYPQQTENGMSQKGFIFMHRHNTTVDTPSIAVEF